MLKLACITVPQSHNSTKDLCQIMEMATLEGYVPDF